VQPAELTDAKQVRKVGEFISNTLGRLDILVNNAAIIRDEMMGRTKFWEVAVK
jgi:NAD(P)-dependent dehydrogenase (short-subunit alcohol dehydrogenase family)